MKNKINDTRKYRFVLILHNIHNIMSVTNNKRVAVKIGKCAGCKKSFDKVQRELGSFCRKCDTSSAGTWALSYLAELDYIVQDDTVENGIIIGRTSNDFLGLPNDKDIHCVVDEYEEVYYDWLI